MYTRMTPVDLKPLKILLQKLDILITSWDRLRCVHSTNSWNI